MIPSWQELAKKNVQNDQISILNGWHIYIWSTQAKTKTNNGCKKCKTECYVISKSKIYDLDVITELEIFILFFYNFIL